MKLRIFPGRVYVIILFISSLLAFRGQAQSYGLGFYGQEVVQDQRTGLELGNGDAICIDGDFSLSFDLSFLTNRTDYFGYVVRIIDAAGNNIDLMYDRSEADNKHFRLVKGDTFSSIDFELDTVQLYSKWTQLTFAFDSDRQLLHFTCGERQFTEKVAMRSEGCFRVLFGMNDFEEFKTTDVPAMKIRDIRFFEDDRLVCHWPLDQSDGTIAPEIVRGKDAMIINPMWLRKKYMDWELLHTHQLRGETSIAFDPEEERVYIVGADSLLSYTVPLGKEEVRAYPGTLFLVNGNQSVYDTAANRLRNFCVDQRIVSTFDTSSGTWDTNYFHPAPGTNFLHINKFYWPADSSIYFIGGYGHFMYKDSVFRYHVPSKTWTFLRPGGDRFTPRYLAALGTSETGAYLVGGYGSPSGQQMLNPRNLYDFLYFDPETRSFETKFELNVKNEDFVFANSLVVDDTADTWYGLVFPKHRYDSSLQLIRGSLTDSAFYFVGNKIPYRFHDVHSFADLFYCPRSKRFVAVTIFRDDAGNSDVHIYSLFSPPLPAADAIPLAANRRTYYLIAIGAALFTGILLWWYRKQRVRKRGLRPRKIPAHIVSLPISQPSAGPCPTVNAVFLFGDLQLLDAEGKDIAGHFSPLLKELFLLLLLHTVRDDKGIGSKKLTELLWYDKSESSARNNRSVNIAKLKSLLGELGGDNRIVKEGGNWKLRLDEEQVYIDYRNYLEIIDQPAALDQQQITALSEIVRRGNFLPQADYEWLDPFKSEISNQVIDTFVHFAHAGGAHAEPEFFVEMAGYISSFDPLNEDAMIIKCRALAKLGKHSLATQAFEIFCKRYQHLYGEAFRRDFKSIID